MAEDADALSRTSVENLTISVLYDARTRCSFCWKYFGNLVLHDKHKSRIISADYVFCSACLSAAKADVSTGAHITFGTSKIRRYNKTVATGNMIRHLRTRHNLVDDFEPQPKKRKGAKEIPKARLDTWVVAKDIVVWYCKSLAPFDSVCDEAMTNFFQKYKMMSEEDELPSNSTVAQSALDYVYERMLNDVAEQIFHDAAPNLSFSIDSWSDCYRKLDYVTITLRYLNQDFKMKKFNLCTRIVDKDQPAKMVEILGQVIKQFGLSDRRIYAVTNNEIMANAALMAGFKQHLCISHGLHNLIIVDGIKAVPEVDILVKKCRKVIEKLNYQMTELADAGALERHLINSFDTVMDTLHSDENDPYPIDTADKSNISAHGTPTRWHCLLEMLEAFITVFNQEQINNVLKLITGLDHLLITQTEWQLMEELVKFLNKFREIVGIITSEDACSVHLILVFRSEIIEALNSCADESSIVMLRIKRNMLSNIDKRFPITDFLIATALLDSRFMGLKQIDFYIESKFMTRASFLAAFIKDSNIDVTQPNELSLLHKLSIKHGIIGDDPMAVHDDMVSKECVNYIDSLDPNAPDDGNILSYWRDRRGTYPRLAVLARALLCVPATNVPSERAFALYGVDLSTKRSRLHPSGIAKIMFIHDNSNVTNI